MISLAVAQAHRGVSSALEAKPTRRGIHSRKDYIRRATPSWADPHEIFAVYQEAAELRSQGFDVEVDHDLPLRGELVSGLHVAANLHIVSAAANRAKSNQCYELDAFPVPQSTQMRLF
tara:strand:- start:355 stop:708 length:354 start_codon:yes stop_codon:yes gene_type:complete